MQPTVRANRNRIYAERSMPLKRLRFTIVCLFFFAWAGVIGGRLFWLQILHHAEYFKRAQQQQQTTTEVPAQRGILYDRNGHELAMTVLADSLYAVPGDIQNKQAAARQLSTLVHTDAEDGQTSEEQIAAHLASDHNSIRLARGVSADVTARVMALGLKGIFVQKEFKRFYPDNEIAAQVLAMWAQMITAWAAWN